MKPENLAGTPWQEEYTRIVPNPENWPALIEKVKSIDREFEGYSDIVRPEHAVQMFRLLGGGVVGDLVGLVPEAK